MSTRATITVADEHDSFDLYQHHDGYPDGPHGLVRRIAMAQRLAWHSPRFEAGDFAAAIIAVLKDRGGSTYLTRDADAHGDRDFHYRIEPLRAGTATRVMLTISRPSWDDTQADVQVFHGDLLQAVSTFNATSETPEGPREHQILSDAQDALGRAQDEINALCGERPDPGTMQVHVQIDEACRDLMRLRQHFEIMCPWRSLELASITSVDAKLALQVHRRFQQGDV